MQTKNSIFTPILIGGSLILLVSFAIRSSFGLFQIPIAEDFGWTRDSYSWAIAIQNLCWGIATPFFGALAEKYGDRKAISLGIILYGLGLIISSYLESTFGHQLINVIIGFGIAGTGFGPILAVVGRSVSSEKRSLALGLTTAAGSAGQVVGPPFTNALLNTMSWSTVMIILAIIILVTLICLLAIKPDNKINNIDISENLSDVLFKAIKDPTFSMLFLGFFSCGFQLGFITAHFPAFITEACASIPPNSIVRSLGVNSTSSLGAFSIAIIGLFNIIGAITAGYLGKNFTKKYLLSMIYAGRTLASIAFIIFPITVESVVIFSIIMGALWLASVPLTSGIVGYIYGMQYMGTLYGIIFLSHQIGSFVGISLGGLFFVIFDNYNFVWWVGIGVGAFSAIIHLPVKEKPLSLRLVKDTIN